MKSILYALSFGWPFLRPYKQRLFLGLGLGGLFGVSGALFVWVTKILFERLTPAGPHAGLMAREYNDMRELALISVFILGSCLHDRKNNGIGPDRRR